MRGLTHYVAASRGTDVHALTADLQACAADRHDTLPEQREMLLTRLELSREAVRNPVLAEVLLATFDGLLLAALQKPARERRGFLSDGLSQLLEAFGASD